MRSAETDPERHPQPRVGGFETINEINGYLASDLMIDKVRDVIAQLVRAGRPASRRMIIQTQLKTIREDSVRQLKDRNELYVDGKDIIQFGNHKFSVNTQALDLSIVPARGRDVLPPRRHRFLRR